MATSSKQAYEIHFRKVYGQITPGIARRAAQEGAREGLRQIRDRNDRSIDANGSKFKKRTKSYMKRKPKLMRQFSGRYSADSASDYMRLSGGLMRAMGIKGVRSSKPGGGLGLDFTLHIKGAKIQKQLEGLRAHGYDPFPLARVGTAQRNKEDRAIIRRVKQVIRVRTGKGVVVNV